MFGKLFFLLLHHCEMIWSRVVPSFSPSAGRAVISLYHSDSICEGSSLFPLMELMISDLSTLPHRLDLHLSFREEVSVCSDMLFRIPCLFLAFVLWGPGRGGPLTNLHPNMTDQELIWGADQYDFSVVLPAAGMECFWHFAHRGERFYLSFMVQWVTGVGHDRHLSVSVNTPSGLLVSTVDDAKGQVNFEAEETGFYQMCFSNFHNRFGTMQVFLSFGVYYDSFQDPAKRKEEEKKKKEEVRKDLNDTLSVIEDASHKVENYVFHMFRYYSFGRMRKSADYFLLLSNSRYITWWSTALSLLIVTSGYLQLLFLKRLFITKTSAEDEKPRC
ncbi:transmembrane emp24 domain-containing protein 6-like [Siniperca chuatsi]|uniref:transmembrane emp24 domain-containing protein 6-like n=1 Tax=Siniperca chuatsi TaxID=119488 RepID=UPI001CE183FA|nr:transmembrane emp24 domain-containing protein 6-like [Siniperca chuatsi]